MGNVPLSLHDWDVDAAAWCTYKYLNGGPGCIGGMFVHARNSTVTKEITDEKPEEGYNNRLAGWWGNDKKTRFVMAYPSSTLLAERPASSSAILASWTSRA